MRENEEKERDLPSTFPHFPLIFSLSIHFLYQKLSLICERQYNMQTQIPLNLYNEKQLVGDVKVYLYLYLSK